jgi:hypothetical protein
MTSLQSVQPSVKYYMACLMQSSTLTSFLTQLRCLISAHGVLPHRITPLRDCFGRSSEMPARVTKSSKLYEGFIPNSAFRGRNAGIVITLPSIMYICSNIEHLDPKAGRWPTVSQRQVAVAEPSVRAGSVTSRTNESAVQNLALDTS